MSSFIVPDGPCRQGGSEEEPSLHVLGSPGPWGESRVVAPTDLKAAARESSAEGVARGIGGGSGGEELGIPVVQGEQFGERG